ncbi:MAG: ArsR family transcriptional regulator [Candidatus Latescibacterota bacterium]|mgnify:CR=1 FL=1|nr:MAG: ArsR family transcriptional regulator [Candidatus Latescibacterota bacterium]RKY65823.1 MAG: ArsR family transcriptional regulator [Candidatus Latescibacterota bacterium]RKY73818.1 MAG: ArsR family transcriptional regulator [Candidatus Latescibacterota bacterium]HDI00361.1 ArsR family transcriptional regulator [Bacillota bacterium]
MLYQLQEIFKALSDGTRLRILKLLSLRPLCVYRLTEILGASQSSVSRHLSVLKRTGLIRDAREGQRVRYRIEPSDSNPYARRILELVDELLEGEEVVAKDRERLLGTEAPG